MATHTRIEMVSRPALIRVWPHSARMRGNLRKVVAAGSGDLLYSRTSGISNQINAMNNQIPLKKKLAIGPILGWIFGVLFALTGLAYVFSEPVPGVVMIIMAAVLLPPVKKLISEKWNFNLSASIKAGIIVTGLIVFGATVEPTVEISETPNTRQVEIQDEQQTSDNTEGSITVDENNDQPTVPAENSEVAEQDSQNENQAPDPSELEENPNPTQPETVSQRNAIRKAKDYLDFTAFSYQGLISQLEHEGFSRADATYGTDNSGADWYEQAAKKAQEYVDYSAFSRSGLISQLIYEKFTQSQAEHGADAVGL